jgi:hypothetical protein
MTMRARFVGWAQQTRCGFCDEAHTNQGRLRYTASWKSSIWASLEFRINSIIKEQES